MAGTIHSGRPVHDYISCHYTVCVLLALATCPISVTIAPRIELAGSVLYTVLACAAMAIGRSIGMPIYSLLNIILHTAPPGAAWNWIVR